MVRNLAGLSKQFLGLGLDAGPGCCCFILMIRFHVLGAGGALPTFSHNPAAYWADVDGDTLLVDPGPGALVRLAKAGLLPDGIDGIERVCTVSGR